MYAHDRQASQHLHYFTEAFVSLHCRMLRCHYFYRYEGQVAYWGGMTLHCWVDTTVAKNCKCVFVLVNSFKGPIFYLF